MVQTSVDICNNVNLDQEMCLRMGEGVYSFTEGLERKWDFMFYWSFFFFLFFFCFLRTYISYKQCIENNNKIYD